MMFPFLGKVNITQEYGVKDPQYKAGYHSGIDIKALGNPTIRAVASGEVIRSRVSSGWGEYVTVRQDDGLFAVYAHMRTGSRVPKVGDRIEAGAPLGLMGSTGNSSGDHLHLEMVKDYWKPATSINVAEYLGIANKRGEYTPETTKTPTGARTASEEPINYKAFGVALVGALIGFGLLVKE